MSMCIAKSFSPNRVLTLTSSEQRCLAYLQPRSIPAIGVRRKPLGLYLGDLPQSRPPHSQPASSGPSNAWRNPSPPFQSAAGEVHSSSLDWRPRRSQRTGNGGQFFVDAGFHWCIAWSPGTRLDQGRPSLSQRIASHNAV